MKISMAVKMAVSAVLSNKLRSFLTMLGIIIGVMAVTLLVSLVQGATNTVTSDLDELGGNQLVVQINTRSRRLTLAGTREMEELPEIRYVSPTMNGNGTVTAAGESMDVSIIGVTERYGDVQGMDLQSGRGFERTDLDYRLNVAVVGIDVARNLFGTDAAENRILRLNGRDYRIIGVLEEAQETLFGNANETVYLPYSNAQRLLSNMSVTSFYAAIEDGTESRAATAALKIRLLEKFGDEDSFTVINMNDIMDIIDRVLSALELLLGAIAGISLVVGGIGIMNIMLVSVTERTREIGIRKAIGAQKTDIVVQFLIESVIISVVGGILGMLISQGILTTINTLYPDYHFAVTKEVAAIALSFSGLIGIIFGIYPANKAAGLKPINALRYE